MPTVFVCHEVPKSKLLYAFRIYRGCLSLTVIIRPTLSTPKSLREKREVYHYMMFLSTFGSITY
jgi:hypothetical protein